MASTWDHIYGRLIIHIFYSVHYILLIQIIFESTVLLVNVFLYFESDFFLLFYGLFYIKIVLSKII